MSRHENEPSADVGRASFQAATVLSFDGEGPVISGYTLVAELSRLVGQPLRVAERLWCGRRAYFIWPLDRALLKSPFWRAVQATSMKEEVDPPLTPEEAVVAFAAGARGWIATASRRPVVGLDNMLRERLATGPVPAAALLAEFAAAGISKDRLARAANRLGVVRRKTGMAGGWLWSLGEGSEGGEVGTEERIN